MPPLERQTIIVTGAALGLGAAVARELAARGARMILMDYNADALAKTAEACGDAVAIVVDLGDADDTERAIGAALDIADHVDTLIHNAAILDARPFEALDLAAFRRTVDVGLQAGF